MKALLILPALSLLAPPALANEICPPALVTSQSAADIPAGFTAANPAQPSRLMSVTFFDGSPAGMAALAPDSDEAGSGKASWSFGPAAPNGIWVACGYDGTQILLHRKLPAGITQCIVTYKMEFEVAGYPEIGEIACGK